MAITTRLSYSLKEGPKFLSGVFFERTGTNITVGVVNKNGFDYAFIQMTKEQFEATVTALLEGA